MRHQTTNLPANPRATQEQMLPYDNDVRAGGDSCVPTKPRARRCAQQVKRTRGLKKKLVPAHKYVAVQALPPPATAVVVHRAIAHTHITDIHCCSIYRYLCTSLEACVGCTRRPTNFRGNQAICFHVVVPGVWAHCIQVQ